MIPRWLAAPLVVFALGSFALACPTSAPSGPELDAGKVGSPTRVSDLFISGQTAGDMLRFDGTNWSRLPIGSSGQALVVDAGVPYWGSAFTVGTSTRLTGLDSNHIHAWELQEAAGASTVADSGNTSAPCTLTVVGAKLTFGVAGLLGSAAYCGSATDCAISSANIKGATGTTCGADFPSGSSPFSMEWWSIETTNGGGSSGCYNVIADYQNGGSLSFSFDRNSANQPILYIQPNDFGVGASAGNGFTMAVQRWRYSAVTFDGSVVRFYVDGNKLYTSAGGKTAPSWTTNGASGNNYFGIFGTSSTINLCCIGLVTRVRMSNVARSDGYIQGVWTKAMYY